MIHWERPIMTTTTTTRTMWRTQCSKSAGSRPYWVVYNILLVITQAVILELLCSNAVVVLPLPTATTVQMILLATHHSCQLICVTEAWSASSTSLPGRGRAAWTLSPRQYPPRSHVLWLGNNEPTRSTTTRSSSSSSSSSRHSTQRAGWLLLCAALYTQVVSDVDDTIKSSGGVALAGIPLGGIDTQYDRGEVYPGVAEFMLQLSLHCNSGRRLRRRGGGASRRHQSRATSKTTMTTTPTPPKIALLTARAEEFKMALEIKEDSPVALAFRRAAQDYLGKDTAAAADWGIGPVLYGSVAEWILQCRKGIRKFANFERLLQQDPTGAVIQYVYVGDTGEADAEAGETMLREYPQLVQAVFLHVVVSDPVWTPPTIPSSYSVGAPTTTAAAAASSSVPVPMSRWINGRPMIYFRTYVGAAVAAVQLDLMSVEGLERVMQAACDQLSSTSRTSDKWIDLERDLRQANEILLL